MTFPLLEDFSEFISERWAIHQRRSAGEAPPWTSDPILLTYRFCNVRREDDRVTRWLHASWLKPHEDDLPGVVFAVCLARIVNHPETLTALGYPKRWDAARFTKVMEARKREGLRTFNAAYMINAVGATKGQSKASYLAAKVLPACWVNRKELAAVLTETKRLAGLHAALVKLHGLGGFMAAQVVADIKWTPSGRAALDWATFAASGPGSRRGLNRVAGKPLKAAWKELEWTEALSDLRSLTLPRLPSGLKRLDAQNLQNCLCEFDKYRRCVEGEGKPKQLYKESPSAYR